MNPKPVVKSKTAWWSAALALAGVLLGVMESPELQGVVAEHAPEALVGIGAVTAFLRLITTGPVAFFVKRAFGGK